LKVSESIGFGPVTSVVMFSDEPDVPIPEYLLPLYGIPLISLYSQYIEHFKTYKHSYSMYTL